MSDLNTIRSLLTAYSQKFARADYSPVFAWLAEGADLERDVMPVMKAWTAKKADIYSLRFFTPHVRLARDERLATKPGPISIHRKASNIAFLTRRLGRCLPRETAWLEAYEKQHGKVTP